MKPGTRWIYRGVEPGSDPEEIVIVATTATKKLANGVTARVVRDTARAKGQIIEDTVVREQRQRRRHFPPRSSRMPFSPSPSRWNPRIVNRMASAGAVDDQNLP